MSDVEPYPARERFYGKFRNLNGDLVDRAVAGDIGELAEMLGQIGLFDESAGFGVSDYSSITNTLVRNVSRAGHDHMLKKVQRGTFTMFALEGEKMGNDEMRDWARQNLWKQGGLKGKFSATVMVVRSITDIGDRTDLEAL